MTGKGRTDPRYTMDNQIGIYASLTHRMSLIVVELPAHVYELYYQGVKQSNNYGVYPSDVRFQAGYYKFCNLYPGQYRFIINPEKAKNTTQYTVDWGWSTSTKRYTYNIDLSDIERNCYRQFSYQNPDNTEEYDLQEGDLYMNDGLLVSKDKDLSGAGGGAIKSNILGVVFSVGHNENDMTDYSETGIGKTTQTNIGYTRLSDNDQWSSTEPMPWQYNEYAIVVTKSEDIVMATKVTKNTKKAEARPFLAF